MFGWLGRRFGKSQQKARQPQPRKLSEDVVAPDDVAPRLSSDSRHSLLKAAIADAEQIATSIKVRAQREAEAEAARIIAQAKLEVQEIKGRAEIEVQKQAEDILSAANRKAEIAVLEVKHKALRYLISVGEEIEKEVREEYKRAYSRLSSSVQHVIDEGQNIEVELKSKTAKLWESKGFELKDYEALLLGTSEAAVPPIAEMLAPVETELEPASKEKVEEPVQLQEEVAEEKVEEPVQLQEEVAEERVEEPVQLQEEVAEEKVEEPVQLQAEVTEEKVEELTPLRLNSQALYDGKVEFTVASPVELKLVSRLYNYLQTIPELKILYTRGSWDQGTTITVVLEKPIPLINLISGIPDVKVTPELLEEGSRAIGKSGLPLGGGEKEIKRIKLTMQEA